MLPSNGPLKPILCIRRQLRITAESMTANGHPVVSERTMPMTAAATAPSQQTISKLNEADAALIQKVASSDPKEFETPSAGQLTRFKEAKKSSIWGRDWTLPAGILLEHPPGDYRSVLKCGFLLATAFVFCRLGTQGLQPCLVWYG